MKSSNTLFIANWKMQKPFSESVAFCKKHHADIIALTEKEGAAIAIAPDFVALDHLVQSFATSNVNIGGQNCSAHKEGAYTGQTSAQSISDTGADFCIVGHSEVRKGYHQTNEDVAQAMLQVLKANMFPVVCIGETEQERSNDETFAVIERQITPLFEIADLAAADNITIAYEPVWAIGTGKNATPSDISNVLLYIKELWEKHLDTPLRLLYGGSISSKNITQFKNIEHLGGFLIGSASLDFKELENIVNLYM